MFLTIRSSGLRIHSGLVAFPGGKQDKDDKGEIAAALREAQEEVGLNPRDVRVLSVLPPSFVSETMIVTPVTATIPNDFVPRANQTEVRKTFDLPLSRFLKDDYKLSKVPRLGGHVCIYHFSDNIGGEKVETWGYTAMVIMRVALVILASDVRREVTDGMCITKDTALSSLTQSKTLQRLLVHNKTPNKL